LFDGAFEQKPYRIRKFRVTLMEFSQLQRFISDTTARGKVPSLSYSYSAQEKLSIALFFMIFLIFLGFAKFSTVLSEYRKWAT
jgi:hypothetical protein